MKSNKQIIGLLKAIFLEVLAVALVLIGYVISGGQTNTLTVILFYAGIIAFFVGLFIGIANFTSPKNDDE